jgi:hypothetical protein
MPAFTGTLNSNSVFAAMFDQIINMQVFDTGIKDLDGIYGSRKVDGSMYGDTKLFISTDIGKSYAWNHSGMSYNLLTQHRPVAPVTDAISINQFRQIPTTTDEYLSKQAYMDEGSFQAANNVFIKWLSDTKRVY